jgi:hypothetical protein
MRYYKVCTRVLPVLPSIHGETVSFAAVIPASSKKLAEQKVRCDVQFQRTMVINGYDPERVKLLIEEMQ